MHPEAINIVATLCAFDCKNFISQFPLIPTGKNHILNFRDPFNITLYNLRNGVVELQVVSEKKIERNHLLGKQSTLLMSQQGKKGKVRGISPAQRGFKSPLPILKALRLEENMANEINYEKEVFTRC